MIAIDPGASGGIAYTHDGQVYADKMPEGMTAIVDYLLEHIALHGIQHAYLEDVGTYVKGDSGPAACKFARHCGNIEAALYALGMPIHTVRPLTWMKATGPFPKDKNSRKKAIKEKMARTYPHLKVTLKTADALGLLTYALENQT